MQQRGFSLIEMILAIVVMGIIALTGSQILSSGVNAYTETKEAIATLNKAMYTLERLKKEIRETRYTSGAYSVTTCTANRYQFTRGDGVTVDIQSAPPSVTLGYSSPAASATLTDQVSSFAFAYYTATSSAATTPCTPTTLAYVDISYTLVDDAASYVRRLRIALPGKP